MKKRGIVVLVSALAVVSVVLVSTTSARQSTKTRTSPQIDARISLPPTSADGRVTPGRMLARDSPEFKKLQPILEAGFRGEFPVHRIDGNRVRRPIVTAPAPIPADIGTKIVTHPDAKGETLALQKEIAATLSKLNLRPQERSAHFDWLWNKTLIQEGSVRFIGWHGGIRNVEPTERGAWIVTVHMYPWFYAPSMLTGQPDHVIETYEYSKGTINLIGSDAKTAKPHLQVFPW